MSGTVRSFAAAALMLSLLSAASAAVARDRLSPEQRLDKLLAGRVAGTPVNCISLYSANRTQVFDKTAIVYQSGATYYVNRPDYPESLDDDDILVTELRGSNQLCSVDVVKLVDRNSHFYDGFVALGKFVPYKRVATN